MGKSSINGQFSMAMLNNQRVYIITTINIINIIICRATPKKMRRTVPWKTWGKHQLLFTIFWVIFVDDWLCHFF
jgi:hypothetical protein